MSGSGDETPPDSPYTTCRTTNSQKVTPVKRAISNNVPSSEGRASNVYGAHAISQASVTGQQLYSTGRSSMDSVHSALNNANDLFCRLYGKNAPSRNQIRKTLELITNMNQMVNVWGENIVNWAKCDDDRITSIDCPCCYICGETISGATHMEHKIPSVSAYLNVPNILRIHSTPFFNKWETYIDASNNFEQLTQLYNLINCTTPYDADAVNKEFNEIFDEVGLNEETGPDYTYWRTLLKFWMMEFAYAHAQCNLFKSDVIMCRPLAAGAGASKDDAPIKNAEICIDDDIISQKYDNITKKIQNSPKNRTIAMFNHLNETLNAVQNSYFERNEFQTAFNNITNYNDTDIRRNTLIAMNMEFAMNAPQIYENINRINEIQDEINLGNTANRPELVILVRQLNELWPGTAERFGFSEYLRPVQSRTLNPPRELNENNESRFTTPTRPSGSSPSYNRRSPNQKRPTTSTDDNVSKKGGTTKNKRRTQKRIASRRRKRNKRSTTRRKRYTRKQKK